MIIIIITISIIMIMNIGNILNDITIAYCVIGSPLPFGWADAGNGWTSPIGPVHGMGIGKWAMGNGQWAMGNRQ